MSSLVFPGKAGAEGTAVWVVRGNKRDAEFEMLEEHSAERFFLAQNPEQRSTKEQIFGSHQHTDGS